MRSWRDTIGRARGGLLRRGDGAGRVAALGVLCLLLGLASAAGAAPEPRAALRRPSDPGPVFVVGSLSFGGTLDHDWLRGGASAGLLFRPNAAADFLGLLYDWNSSLVLQGEWRSVDQDRRLFGVALLLRRYTRDMRTAGVGASPFIGVGVGGAEGTLPAAAATETAVTHWLGVAEIGWEVSPDAASVFFAKAQWHVWRGGPLDYSGWSFHFGAGIPVPW